MPLSRDLILSRIKTISTPGTKRFIRKGVWGLADQALISATNFTTMVLVARVVSPAEFGLYSLAYTGLLFTNSIQSGLVVQPHTVLGAKRSGTDYVAYTTDTGWFQYAFAFLTALVALCMATAAALLDWWVAPILFALVPATAAWQLQDFVRRVLYTKSEISGAFLNDLVSYGGQLLTLLLLWRSGYLTPVNAVLALAATSAIGFLLGLWEIRAHVDWSFNATRIRTTMGINWEFGKWLVGEKVAYWTASQIYPVLAAGLVSVTATGVLRAAQTIIGPTNVFMFALDPLFGPKTAKLYASGGLPALRALLTKLQLLVFLAMGTYCVTVAFLAEPILRHVYGSQYSQYSWVLVLVALISLANTLRSPIRIGLKALGETNAIFRAYLTSSAFNLTLGLAAVYLFGLKGVAAGMLLNALVLQIMMWRFHHKFFGGTVPIFLNLPRRRIPTSETPEQRHA